ncbi:hypothetical protein ES708_04065 [subsurface metagenome]
MKSLSGMTQRKHQGSLLSAKHNQPKKKTEKKRTSLSKWALMYARKGLAVLPLHYPVNGVCSCKKDKCRSIGKHPIAKHGVNDATTDEDTIRIWWSKWPNANIGIATGKKSKLIVIDIDPRHGGNESFQELEEKYGVLPNTTRVQTGGNGTHLLFRYPESLEKVKSRPLQGFPGVDLVADGAYIVTVPSRHASGKYYRFDKVNGTKPLLMSTITEEYITLIGKANNSQSKKLDLGQAIPEGQRNVKLTQIAGVFHSRGMNEDTLLD